MFAFSGYLGWLSFSQYLFPHLQFLLSNFHLFLLVHLNRTGNLWNESDIIKWQVGWLVLSSQLHKHLCRLSCMNAIFQYPQRIICTRLGEAQYWFSSSCCSHRKKTIFLALAFLYYCCSQQSVSEEESTLCVHITRFPLLKQGRSLTC